MVIIIYLGCKYAISHHLIELVCTDSNIYNLAPYTQTLLSKSTAYYNLILTNYFYLKLIHQVAQNSYI